MTTYLAFAGYYLTARPVPPSGRHFVTLVNHSTENEIYARTLCEWACAVIRMMRIAGRVDGYVSQYTFADPSKRQPWQFRIICDG